MRNSPIDFPCVEFPLKGDGSDYGIMLHAFLSSCWGSFNIPNYELCIINTTNGCCSATVL